MKRSLHRLTPAHHACLLVATALLCLACAAPPVVEERVPLFSGGQTPLILTEQDEIATPPSLEPNRLVRGWWPYKRRGEPRLGLLEGARLQGVNLSDVRRRLVLEGDVRGTGELEFRFNGGEWERLQLARRIGIPLPRDLPPGRFIVDLRVSGDGALGLARASFSKVAPVGEVRFVDADLLQSGFSAVEVVQRVGVGGVLSGAFRPPADAGPNQRFSISIATEDGQPISEVFSWELGEGEGDLDFSVPLPSGAEFARVRLLATGSGPVGRWQDLAMTSGVRRVAADAQVAAPPAPKVVVLYILDALRRDHVGHLGGPAGISPVIDRLAAEGVTFEQHFSIAPNTVPSMKSLFTGRVFLDTGGFKLPADVETLAESFRRAGFRTGLFSGNGNVSDWRGLTQGFEHVARRVLFASHTAGPDAASYNDNAEQVHAAALHWVESLDPDERVFMHLQTVHPHNPFDPPEPFLSRFAGGSESAIDGSTDTLAAIARGEREASAADRERIKGLYAASVAYNDHHLGLFLERLLERYRRDEILLVVTSDHGEELFDHESLLHGYTLYDEQLRIPLVFWWPGTLAPGRVEGTTVNLDLHATLGEFGKAGATGPVGGRSLWPQLLGAEGDGQEDGVVFAAASSVAGGIFMARSDDLKVVYAPRRGHDWGIGQGRGRLRDPEFVFDLRRDPGEQQSLAGEISLEGDWLWSRLLAWVDAGRQLEVGVPLEDLDEETRNSLRALGYLQ